MPAVPVSTPSIAQKAPAGRLVFDPRRWDAPGDPADPVGVAVPQKVVPGQTLTLAPVPVVVDPGYPSTGFTLTSFNILGSQHTARGGAKAHYADGVTRARWAAPLMRARGWDVIGFQELQVDQLRTLQAATGGTYDYYPSAPERPSLATPTTLMWDAAQWDLVEAYSFTIPFLGQQRPMPVVRLKNATSGAEAWFVNVHLTPRRDRRDGEPERDAATRLLVAQVKVLQESGLPVFVTGDMNEKVDIFCDLSPATGLVASAGGSVSSGCAAPRNGVDWIFASPEVSLSGHRVQRDRDLGRITDHAVIVTEALIAGVEPTIEMRVPRSR